MSSQPENNSYIALIGAYERDNFGDILFLKVCSKLLEPWPIVPLSLLSKNMQKEGGGTIVSASAWFECCEYNFHPKAIIVAGGEVLTCPFINALSCGIDPARSKALFKVDQFNKKRIEKWLSWRTGELAYVPDLNKLLDKREYIVPIALNSVGGSKLELGSHYLPSLKKNISSANYISVRDEATHNFISNNNFVSSSIELNPDIVSTLGILYRKEVEDAFINSIDLNPWLTEPYLLVQANDGYITENDPERIGLEIVKAARAFNLSLVFQPAGIATGHDSFEMLDKLSQIAQAHSGDSLNIYIQRNRDIWAQVAVIAHSACFVGTSLHGRVVAAAYSRPRVGLVNPKVNIYASTWEKYDLQPFDVPIQKLLESVEKAMNTSSMLLIEHAEKQAELALNGFTRLRSSLNLYEPPKDNRNVYKHISNVTKLAYLHECQVLREAVLDLGYELSEEQKLRRSTERKLSNVLQSGSWRITKPLRAIRRLFIGGMLD